MGASKPVVVTFAWLSVGLVLVGLIMTGTGSMSLSNSVRFIGTLMFFFYGWLFAIMLLSLVPSFPVFIGLILTGAGFAFGFVDAILASTMEQI